MSNKSKGFDKILYKTMINERNDQRINAIENLKKRLHRRKSLAGNSSFSKLSILYSIRASFYYSLKTGRNGELTKELWVNRRENSKSLAWSSVVLAFQHARQIS